LTKVLEFHAESGARGLQALRSVGVTSVLLAASAPSVPTQVDPLWIAILLDPKMRIFAFIWGALWGSFGNVVIYRLPQEGMSVVSPGSRCGSCETPIAWYDNIPILSYLILRGRCRKCKTGYSMRYMLVEIICGILSFSLFMAYAVKPMLQGAGLEVIAVWLLWFAFCWGLVIITFTDLDWWIIPDELSLGLFALGMGAAIYDPTLLGVTWKEAGLAALIGYGLVWGLRFIYLKTRGIEAMGLGDGKLLMAVGAFGGLNGFAWTLGAGAIQGLLVSIPLLLLGKNVANSDLQEVHGDDPELGEEDPDAGLAGARVPFGPFLALAALEYVLLRPQIDALFNWFYYGSSF
jgi:leader peptidase (prepilin peptidase)/N-methyltransferase